MIKRPSGLTGRLILLLCSFALAAELLIYVPAVAAFRRGWLSERLMGAQMIGQALTGRPPETLSGKVEERLVAAIRGARAIGVRASDARWVLADGGREPPPVLNEVDLREAPWHGSWRGLLRTLSARSRDLTRVTGPGLTDPTTSVELIFDESVLRAEIVDFTVRFVAVSLGLAATLTALLYAALHASVVRPLRRMAANLASFSDDPLDATRVLEPSGRPDEIGRAEEALARMETTLAQALRRNLHLADLGLAVSKINHELRNMLATSQLIVDHLLRVDDPDTRRIAPRLVRTLGRAIEYCNVTLSHGRAGEPLPTRRRLRLKPLLLQQLDLVAAPTEHAVAFVIEVPDELSVHADPDQLARIVSNLVSNSVEAFARAETSSARFVVSAEGGSKGIAIRLADNGPGIPELLRSRLFHPFQASTRSGGTGLGLSVAEELARLNGGSLTLDATGPQGTTLLLTLPH